MNLLWSREEFNRLMRRIRDLRGSTFIQSSGFKEGRSDYFLLQYFPSFDDYKQSNPSTTLKKKDFDEYFQTGWACDKILTLESMRVLREFPKIQTIEVHVPPFGLYSAVVVDRAKVPTVISPNPLDLSQESSWYSFVDHVGYDRKMRALFLKFFGTITPRAEFY